MRQVVKDYMSALFPEPICTNIEKSIYNASIDACTKHKIPANWEYPVYQQIYTSIFLRVKQYLLMDSIKQDILSQTLLAKDVGYLTGKDLEPEKWNLEHLLQQDEVTEDGVFQCGKCGSKKTTYYSLQTRSADEPMTNFITCCNCKNRWKM